jgi:hypothetical protein
VLALDVQFAAGGGTTGDVICACCRSQYRIDTEFSAALDYDAWPMAMRQLLAAQHERMCGTRAVLVGLY